jgi:hypothetical protein
MKRMVQYKVKPERVDENERHVRAVYEELHRVKPAGLRYATFRLPDGQSFLHLVSHEAAGSNPLTALPAFKAFAAQIQDRCETPPVTTDLEEIGSYGFFD